MDKPASERSWWTTLPGLLTGVAALLTAVTGLLAVLLPLLLRPGEPGSAEASRSAVVPTALPSERRDTTAGQPAQPADTVPRRTAPIGPAPAVQPNQQAETPPLILGERLEIAGSFFEVLNVESTSPRSEMREIRVTFRATAGTTNIGLSRSNVRILTPGQIHRPVEGLPATTIRAGAGRQLWVRFEIEEPVRDPILSFTDDMFSPRGEVRRALPAHGGM